MDIRKSAVDLTEQERDRFLEAVIRLKHRPAPGGSAGVSVYDQFVVLHGAVMAVITPGLPPGETVNFAHWDIGFCAWHRKYLREFERALQQEVNGVAIPYWDWTDHAGAVNKLFIPEFLGSLHSGVPGPVTDGVLRDPVPGSERPAWWPAGADGFPVHPLLEDTFGTTLARGSAGVGWPATAARIAQLERLVIQEPGVHPLWYFWQVLEEGNARFATRTHNRGHNFIGGHMSGAFSPNDPVFWLHHANVDRLWADWQERRLSDVPGSKPDDHYPPSDELSPFTGSEAPAGHRLDDLMWPWVGGAPGFDVDLDPAVKPLLPDFSSAPAAIVREMLDTDAVGYRYDPPGAP
ncbi:tyrosinase family protein [Streptomyces sp. H27-D2]|uniref:tyrosinase family protein n=1 Tax=Streptomyces sp. H27-D2 TaxID=3046304 RepID=UPI002DBDB4EC|nr:tyrosinase family protein [Streptomyces sp. H27-D2]MEC4017893.1 tyrosinase family protein [Streptomyces sp. H27-D2]